MPSYVFLDPLLGMPAIDSIVADGTSTAPKPWRLGDTQKARDTSGNIGEYIYLKGAASTLPKSWVSYNPLDYSTQLLASNAIGPVAVAMATTVGSYTGWYCISGRVSAKAAQSFADNGNVYITATSGTVDDAVVAGDLVVNAKGAGAETSANGYADFELWRPYVTDRAGAVPGVASPTSAAPASVSATQWGFATSTLAQAVINATTG